MNPVVCFLKTYIPVLLLLVLFSSVVLMCSVPPVSRDALTHHLAVPWLYVQRGNIYELPEIIHSYNPQLLDLIYCIPLALGNDIAPKYIHFAFALFTAILLFLYLKQKLGHFYGWAGAIFFLSLPVIVKLSITVYVDLGVIFFSTASLMCLLKWHGKNFQFRWFFLSGIFCGLALSTKYNGLVTCFLLTASTPFLYLNGSQSYPKKIKDGGCTSIFKKKRALQIKALGYGAGFLFISMTIFSPWMIKNYVWTKNPVYPLFDTYFNPIPETSVINKSSNPTMNHFLIRKYIYKESWFETATIPLRIFFQGKDDDPKLFDGKLNPLLFILPFFAFIFHRKTSTQDLIQKKALLIFALLYILIVFLQQDMRIRWMGPAIPPLIILSAFGLKNLFHWVTPEKILISEKRFKPSRLKRSVLFVLILSVASLNAVYILQLFKKIAPLTYITNQVTRSEYIEKFRPEFASLQFANQYLNGDIKLLAFFLGNRRYYSTHDIRFNDALFKKLVQDSETAKGIVQGLKTQNFTNLIINYPKFNSWADTNFNMAEKNRIQEFFNQNTKKLFSKDDHGLYQLK